MSDDVSDEVVMFTDLAAKHVRAVLADILPDGDSIDNYEVEVTIYRPIIPE